MVFNHDFLSEDELLTFKLKAIYEQYGYKKFRMARFEPYDFYLKNRNYLSGGNLITFGNPDGRLMALKPDITLSIIKNTNAGSLDTERYYYAENVYREKPGLSEYKEIFQVGVEYLGNIDAVIEAEIIILALKSLFEISSSFILDISHTGYVDAIVSFAVHDENLKGPVFKEIERKNSAGLEKISNELGLGENEKSMLLSLVKPYTGFNDALGDMEQNITYTGSHTELPRKMKNLFNIIKQTGYSKNIRLDFSIPGNRKYYNGIMLTGYIDGLPNVVLKGGRYDPLLLKMEKNIPNAMGYAIYFDSLEPLFKRNIAKTVQSVIIYNDSTPQNIITEAVNGEISKGNSIWLCKSLPCDIEYKNIIDLKEAPNA